MINIIRLNIKFSFIIRKEEKKCNLTITIEFNLDEFPFPMLESGSFGNNET